jgi:oxygen-independent coproporphyrinogen III oxidase
MSESKPAALAEPEVGSYFVANYPPFSVWTPDAVRRDALPALARPAACGPKGPLSISTSLGLYLHIPFCRKRCHFCYFRVYTNKNAQQVEDYLDLVVREWALLSAQPALRDRALDFVYVGGGTPSFLSTTQLSSLVSRLTATTPWDRAKEITFECEPGTLTEAKLDVIRRLGVTRLSLGVENFDDRILEINGRAHRSPEIGRAYAHARRIGFPQINIDLIAGMLGESDDNWRRCVERTLELAPDSVTMYQMELPFNTTISADLLKGTGQFQEHVASWETRRRWVREAFEILEHHGYRTSSAYTAIRDPERTTFVYRDELWAGADLAGLGVASFGHVNGVHVQNVDTWERYAECLDAGELPIGRAYRPTDDERLIRETILQLKRGAIRPDYFAAKFGVDVADRFDEQWASIAREGYLAERSADRIALTREGLLRVDSLLHRFFLPEHRGVRYT